jgi:hypothetical protein
MFPSKPLLSQPNPLPHFFSSQIHLPLKAYRARHQPLSPYTPTLKKRRALYAAFILCLNYCRGEVIGRRARETPDALLFSITPDSTAYTYEPPGPLQVPPPFLHRPPWATSYHWHTYLPQILVSRTYCCVVFCLLARWLDGWLVYLSFLSRLSDGQFSSRRAVCYVTLPFFK